MDKKMKKELLIITMVIMLGFPIFINVLMFIPTFKVAGDQNTWISLLGTFWGAIIGGVIAGVLTLYGVQRTIKHNEEIKQKNNFPEKIHRLEKICFYLDTVYSEVQDLLSKSFQGSGGFFFTIIDKELYKQSIFFTYTDQMLDKVGADVVYVDSFSYREFFQSRREINDLFKTVMGDISIKLWRFSQGDEEIQEDFTEIYNQFFYYEVEYISELGRSIGQLKDKLTNHYLNLIDEMDY